MDEHVLAIGTLECADWGHHAAAGAGAVTRAFGVYVAGVEAVRAVVAVMSATGQRADEAMAVAAGEAVVDWPAPLASVGGAITTVRTLRRLGTASFAWFAQQRLLSR
jgi:hypothetical protein